MNAEQIILAISTTGVCTRTLSATERQEVLIRLNERLGVNVAGHAPWDQVDAPDGKYRPDGWECLPKYVGLSACFMFLDGAKQIWEFKSGNDLLKVLMECPALEFYICDQSANYLLCHNHHDFVIGWGTARQVIGGQTTIIFSPANLINF